MILYCLDAQTRFGHDFFEWYWSSGHSSIQSAKLSAFIYSPTVTNQENGGIRSMIGEILWGRLSADDGSWLNGSP